MLTGSFYLARSQ